MPQRDLSEWFYWAWTALRSTMGRRIAGGCITVIGGIIAVMLVLASNQ
jgi:hypothetical protein